MKNFLRRIIWIFIYHFWLKHYFKRRTTTSLLGFFFNVPPTVFHPKFAFSSKFFGEFVQQLDLRNKSVLDMGTGSGIIGIVAASKGANVIAVDINQEAINCAKENAKNNSVENNISFFFGNLFSPFENSQQKFDYIFFNPPFYPKPVTNTTQHAWNAGEDFETIQRFANEAKQFLSSGGKIYFIISSDVDVERICSFFKKNNFTTDLVTTKHLFFEKLFVYEVNPVQEK